MKILVVDDDPVGRMVSRTVVESLGHDVTAASDGEQAWHLLRTEGFDVVVTDREMPGLDGLELCRRLRALGRDEPGERAYTYVVLVTGHDAHDAALEGMQAGADDYLGKPLDADLLRLRLIAAERVTRLHAQLAAQQRELAALTDAEHELARKDPLTLLPNRRALQEELDRLDARAQRSGARYHLALLDVDHFKGYNDAAGHVAGDDALRRLAAAMSAEVRLSDGLYRYGGEAFVHVIDGGSPEGALRAVERLREAVVELALPHASRTGQVLTVSAGMAGSEPGQTASAEALGAADTALYRAKSSGRNRTEQADPATDAALSRRPKSTGDDNDSLLDPVPLEAMDVMGRRIGRALAEEVVDTYLRQSGERVTSMQAALDRRSADELTRGAHALLGSSATIGATAVSQVCAELEQAHLWQRRSELMDELHTLAAATDRALSAHLVRTLRSGAA
jgi:two-component system chemotaxis response regulator CheY